MNDDPRKWVPEIMYEEYEEEEAWATERRACQEAEDRAKALLVELGKLEKGKGCATRDVDPGDGCHSCSCGW